MLPNLYIPPLIIFGPIQIHPFGVLVAVAVLLGYELGIRRARRVGLDPRTCATGMIWAVVGGFAMAHWFFVVFYFPEQLAEDPLSFFAFWGGLSSFGGFVGGFLAAWIYFRKVKAPFVQYGEAALFGFVPAWILGRLGCTIVFDHPGLKTDFILGMEDNHGVVRHNLGLYEMLLAVFLTIAIYALKNKRVFEGFHVVLVLLIYAPVRIFLDSLRIADKVYWGFTAGQFFSFFMLGLAVYLVFKGLMGRKKSICTVQENAETQ